MLYQISSIFVRLVAFGVQIKAVAFAVPGETKHLRGDSKSAKDLLRQSVEKSNITVSSNLAGWHTEFRNISHLEKTNAFTNSTATHSQVEPRIFFLFLTLSGIERPDIWRAFFEDQSMTRWSVFVHCKELFVCKNLLTLAATQVSTVPSEYCQDLVSPMAQLLGAALVHSFSQYDKFVFLSETTIPIKPFSHIYTSLTSDQNSDFCLYSKDEWVRFTIEQNLHTLVLKHSQWVVLNRMHATSLVQGWPGVKSRLQGSMLSVPWYRESLQGPSGAINVHRSVLDICTDEWAIFATIYGAFVNNAKTYMGRESLPGLSGPPVQLVGTVHSSQGICRTFAFWETTEFGDSELIKEISQDMSGTRLSCYPKCVSTHPAVFEALSDHVAFALRHSRYLFARKFKAYVPTLEQFRRILIS